MVGVGGLGSLRSRFASEFGVRESGMMGKIVNGAILSLLCERILLGIYGLGWEFCCCCCCCAGHNYFSRLSILADDRVYGHLKDRFGILGRGNVRYDVWLGMRWDTT